MTCLDPQEVETKYQHFLLDPGDYVVSSSGTLGRIAEVRDEDLPCMLNTSVIRMRPKSDTLDRRFLKYFLLSELYQQQVLAFAAGSVQANYGPSHLRQMKIVLPPLMEQRGIAEALSSLDDKIELNRRMNETLEAMAQAIFRDWFVDFGPVRRKLEGATDPVAILGGLMPDPARAAELAGLFPDGVGEDELPVGWIFGGLGELVNNAVDRCSPSIVTENRPYVPIDTITAGSLIVQEARPGIEAQSSLVTFREGDILFGAMRPYFHKVALASFEGTTRTTVFVLRPRSRDDLAFALMTVNAKSTIDFATAHSSGTTIPYAVWGNAMESMPVILPPALVRFAFGEIVSPMLERLKASAAENRTLAETRDYLLPRLMSGDIRVTDASREFAA
jgi:type I restriction enzyme S subunit